MAAAAGCDAVGPDLRGVRAACGLPRGAGPAGCLVLHCPSGHLGATVGGLALGLLGGEAVTPPSAAELRSFFRRVLRHRRLGELNELRAAAAAGPRACRTGRVFFLARGAAGPITETVLQEMGRLAGLEGRLWVEPALRTARAPAGRGSSPCSCLPSPLLGLYLACLASRLLSRLALHGPADALMSLAVRRYFGLLRGRAERLPSAGLLSDPWSERAGAAPPGRGPGPEHGAGPPRVLYHCFGATHSSVVAAALHLGRLGGPDAGQAPSSAEVAAVQGFDRRVKPDIGRAFYAGTAEDGCEVFTIGFGGSRWLLSRASADLVRLAAPARRVLIMVDTLRAIGLLVRLGGIASRRLGLVTAGRPLAALGIRLCWRRLRGLAAAARMQAARCRSCPAVAANQGHG